MIQNYLSKWKLALDSQIGDTTAEIEKRRNDNNEACEARRDVEELIKFIATNKLPDRVEIALERCLRWNPFAT